MINLLLILYLLMDIIKKTRKGNNEMIKSERGSITVFVVSICLFVLFILVGIFMRNQNKIINQKEQLEIIQEKYNDDNIETEMAQTYAQILQEDENTINADLKIATPTQLKDFAIKVNKGETFEGKTIILTSNIDMSSVCSSSTKTSWTPIGNATNTFKGTFDGRNYTIENIYINNIVTDYQGLFGYNDGIIKNVNLSNGTIIGRRWVAGIAGYNNKSILNCYSDITLSSTASAEDGLASQIGGIAGTNQGNIEKCCNVGKISASSNQCRRNYWF